MLIRLHREYAALNSPATLARINARHWFAGLNLPANDDGVI